MLSHYFWLAINSDSYFFSCFCMVRKMVELGPQFPLNFLYLSVTNSNFRQTQSKTLWHKSSNHTVDFPFHSSCFFGFSQVFQGLQLFQVFSVFSRFSGGFQVFSRFFQGFSKCFPGFFSSFHGFQGFQVYSRYFQVLFRFF